MKFDKFILLFLITFLLNCSLVEAQKYEEFESKGDIKNGVKEGRWIDVNKHGIIYKEYFYKNGKPIGTWKRFCPDGKIRNESFIVRDKVSNFKMYKPTLASVEIICDSGFSQIQYMSLLDYEEYFYSFFDYFEIIAQSPFLFESVDYIKEGYRRCPCGPDTIYYRINDSVVEIMAIIGMQDLKNIL